MGGEGDDRGCFIGTLRSSLRSPAQVEGTQGLLSQIEKYLEIPSSTRLEALSPTMTREQCRAPHCNSNGDLTSLAQHDRLPEFPFVPREKTHTGAAARENPPSSRDEGLFSCMARKTIPNHLSKVHRRLYSLYATQWAPRDTRRGVPLPSPISMHKPA